MSASPKPTHPDRQANSDAPLSAQPSPCANEFSLQRRVKSFLECRHVPGIEHIEVEVGGNTVTVHGVLPSSDAKRICLECCRHVAGVIRLIDDVEVESSPQKSASQGSDRRPYDGPTRTFPRNSL